MKAVTTLLILMLTSTLSFAALLTTEGQGEKIEKLTLATAAQAGVDGAVIKLSSVGAGLRAKKVVFVNVRVYVGQLYVASPEKFKKNDAEALGSVKDQKAIAMQLHFLRNVDAESVQKSFKEALKVNGVSEEDANVKEFLAAVANGKEASEGKALTILGLHNADGSESVSYETTSGQVTVIKGVAGFVEKVFAIWLGKPADDGVAALKKAMLK
jgi:hypothetical protein